MLRRTSMRVALGSLLLSALACNTDSSSGDNLGGTRPPPPTFLTLTPEGDTGLRLQWGAPAGPVDGFILEARFDAEVLPYREIPGGRPAAGELERVVALDTIAAELIPLAFRVRSFVGSQVSEPTIAEVFDVPLWPPADVRALPGDGGVDLSWTGRSRRADSILIERLASLDAGAAQRTWTVLPTSGQLRDGEVIEGTGYWYRFRSATGDLTSAAIDIEVMVE